MPPSNYSGNFEYDMIHGLTRVETALEGINARLDRVNGQLDAHADKLDTHGNKLVTLDSIERRISSTEEAVASHQSILDQNTGERGATGHFWTAIWAAVCVAGAEVLRWLLGSKGH